MTTVKGFIILHAAASGKCPQADAHLEPYCDLMLSFDRTFATSRPKHKKDYLVTGVVIVPVPCT